MIQAVHAAAVRLPLLPHLGKVWRSWANRRDLTRACELVPAVLAIIPPQEGAPSPVSWIIQRAEWTDTDVVVIALGPLNGPVTAILKLPQTPDGVRSQQRQAAVLTALLGDLGSCAWRDILPNPLVQGEMAGQAYVVEQALPGRQAQGLLSDPVPRARLQTTAAASIGELHRRTARSVVVGGELLDRWVDRPVDLVRRSLPTLFQLARYDQALERLVAEIHESLAGRTLPISWIHGDFWPGNMLVTPDGAMLTGLVDWDLAARDELPLHDLLHLVLYTRKLVQRCELGDIVRALLNGEDWSPHERGLLESAGLSLMDEAAGERAMVLLYWLRHIASNFVQSPDCGRNWFWVKKNIEGVLGCL